MKSLKGKNNSCSDSEKKTFNFLLTLLQPQQNKLYISPSSPCCSLSSCSDSPVGSLALLLHLRVVGSRAENKDGGSSSLMSEGSSSQMCGGR